ncbi:MAG TPA: ribosome small subunit-dependent GTPase A [Bacteroidales bacterium]|nr:ribosome small subunit-dependent GTPase A [Bacteroidales bacterium]
MNINDLGLTAEIESLIAREELNNFTAGRVTQQHKERYIVSDGETEYPAEITGNLRYTAEEASDLPAVGDWVLMTVFGDDLAIINKVLPRKTLLERQATGKHGETQVIATNIDVAMIVQSIDFKFNVNRLERYLVICHSAGISPVFVISKTDTADEESVNLALGKLKERNIHIPVIALSNVSRDGYDKVYSLLVKGQTYCVLGSSGVGKSTLINNLAGREILATGKISDSTNKGRHVTSSRQMIILENGAILIDTPGMKELGITDDIEGVTVTFEEITSLSLECKFPDCTHTDEAGCAVTEAVRNGVLSSGTLVNYKKMIREQERFTKSVAEKRKKDKEFGKMVKSVLKEKKKNKF